MQLTMLEETYKSLDLCARGLGNYHLLTKTELANGGYDAKVAGDDVKYSQYFAAIMLRYWYKIFDWQRRSKTLNLDYEDFIGWLSGSIESLMFYHDWRKPTSKLYNDPNGPDKILNRCFFSMQGFYYQYYNQDKRRVAIGTNTLNFSSMVSEDDSSDGAGGSEPVNLAALTSEQEVEFSSLNSPVLELIKQLVEEKRVEDAVIIENLAYEEAFVTTRKRMTIDEEDVLEGVRKQPRVYQYAHTFSKTKLVRSLRNIDSNYVAYFSSKFSIDEEMVEEVRQKFVSSTTQEVGKSITSLFKKLSKSKGLKESLC